MIERPVSGQKLRAGWGAEVADRLNSAGAFASPGMLVREGAGGSTVAPVPANNRERRGAPGGRPQPFEVRFDQTLNENQGGLKIFLDGDKLVAFDNTYVATSAFSGVAAITGQDGWYELSGVNLQSDSAVYLTLTASAAPQVALTYAPAAQTEGGAYVFSICIALFSYTPATSTAPASCTVTQQTVGALYIGKRPEDPPEPEPCGYPGVDDVSIDETGQTSGESSGGTLQIKGFAAGTPVASTTLVADLETLDTANAMHLLCRCVSGGVVALKYKSIGNLAKTFTCDNVLVAHILADDDIDIGQKTLKAGEGVALTVSPDGKIITISAPGAGSAATSGYTGVRTIIGDTAYDQSTHTLRRRYITETWANGLMVSQTLGAWETYHTAVQETV